jgi:hypothetical protein
LLKGAKQHEANYLATLLSTTYEWEQALLSTHPPDWQDGQWLVWTGAGGSSCFHPRKANKIARILSEANLAMSQIKKATLQSGKHSWSTAWKLGNPTLPTEGRADRATMTKFFSQ